MKKKGLIIILSLVLVGIIATSIPIIRAWLTDTEKTPDVSFTVGDVEFAFGGKFISDVDVIVPGQDLISSPFTLTNESNVGTELRFFIAITYLDNIDGVDTTVDAFDLAIVDIDSTNNKWVLSDGYYYYRETGVVDSTSEVGKHIITKDKATSGIEVLSSIKLDGAKVGNSFTGKVFSIVITFEAKQSQYVTWAEMGSIDFTAGI